MAKKTVRGTKVENLLLQLFKKKPDIHQPGRLLAHLENELNGQVSQNDILLALERMVRRRKFRPALCESAGFIHFNRGNIAKYIDKIYRLC